MSAAATLQQEQFEAEQALLTRATAENVKRGTGLLDRLVDGFEAVFGLIVVSIAFFFFRVEREFNSAATGHMITVLDQVHAAGDFDHTGLEVAAAFENGFLRFFYFDNLAMVPEALVIAFSTTSSDMNTQKVMLANPNQAVKNIVQTVQNHQDWGVLQIVCEALSPLSSEVQNSTTCQKQLCTSKGKGKGKAVQSAINTGIMGSFAGEAIAGPIGFVLGGVAAGLAGYFTTKQAQCQNKLCDCS